jgi:hypothetical protein
MLGIDHQHGRFGSDQPGADPGVSGRQRRGAVCRAEARRSIRMDRANAAAASVRWFEQTGKGTLTPVRGAHDGPEPGTGDTPDLWLCGNRPRKGGAVSADEVCDPLHESGRGTAGLRGQKSRQPERAGNEKDTGTRVQRIRTGRIRAAGGHFRGADLPIPQFGGLPQEEHQLPADAAHANSDRRAAQTATAGSTGLPAHRYCASRETGTASKAFITSMRSTK